MIGISKESGYLLEWLRRFVENRDIIQQSIDSIEEKDDELHVKHKTKEHIYVILPFLEGDEPLNRAKAFEGHSSVVCFNTKDNFKYVLDNWKKIIAFGRHFSIYFVNPFSKEDKKWIVYPFTHNQICEGENIEMGLKSLAGSVETITKEEVGKILE